MSYTFCFRYDKHPFVETQKILEWTIKHCSSYITNDAFKHENGEWYYRFYFYDEKDYILFMLKWV
jgi:hypothetical protein